MGYGPIGFRPVPPWVVLSWGGLPGPTAQGPAYQGMPGYEGPVQGVQGPGQAPIGFGPRQAPAAGAYAPTGGGACIGSQDLEFLRQDLRGELEAINEYYRHAQVAKDPRVRDLLCEIMNDEKHHYAELTKLIRALDATQDQFFRELEG